MDKQAANAQLSAVVDQIMILLDEARNLAHTYGLTTTISLDEGSIDITRYGIDAGGWDSSSANC